MSRYTPWHDNDDLELAPLSQQREEQQHDTTSHRKLATHDLLAWVTTIINDHRLVTTGVIALAAVMEKLDEQLLPSVYPYVARSLRASPAALGYLTLSRALVQSISSPLGGLLGHAFNRVHIITGGISIWTTMTALFAAATAVWQGCVLWAVNGVGLAMVVPNCQSIVADYWPAHQRGRAFGVLQFTMNLGGMLGALWGTNVGARSLVAGMTGWRWAFLGVAMASGVSGVLTYVCATEPRSTLGGGVLLMRGGGAGTLGVSQTGLGMSQTGSWSGSDVGGGGAGEERDMLAWSTHGGTDGVHGQGGQQHGQHGKGDDAWGAIKRIVLLPTFGIIILQGIAGTFPWIALSWATTYLQLIGLSPWHTSVVYSVFLGAGAPGSIIGGLLGDWAAYRSPKYGRIAVAQTSVTLGIPLTVVALRGMPLNGSMGSVVAYALLMLVMGLCITWCAPACNNPIFAEVVPETHRSLIYAFDRSFEGALAALAAPLVGILAQHLGFDGVAEVDPYDHAGNLRKARALADALLLCTCVPWGLCACFYSGLYWTYPRDKERGGVEEGVEGEGDEEHDMLLQGGQ